MRSWRGDSNVRLLDAHDFYNKVKEQSMEEIINISSYSNFNLNITHVISLDENISMLSRGGR